MRPVADAPAHDRRPGRAEFGRANMSTHVKRPPKSVATKADVTAAPAGHLDVERLEDASRRPTQRVLVRPALRPPITSGGETDESCYAKRRDNRATSLRRGAARKPS